MEEDLYDTDLDQEAALRDAPESTEKDDTEDVGAPFLAPKSAFSSSLEVGSTHTVRVEAIHAEEVELVCTGKSGRSAQPSTREPDESNELYD